MLVRVENLPGHRARQRAVSRRPRDVLQRDELVMQNAIRRGIRDGEVKFQAEPGEGIAVADSGLRLREQRLQALELCGARVLRRQLGRQALYGVLRDEDFLGFDAGPLELDG